MPGNYGNPYKSLRVRHGVKADIPLLNDGEVGLCTDTHELAVGYSGVNYFFALATGGGAVWMQYGTVAAPVVVVPASGLVISTTDNRQAHLIKLAPAAGALDVTADPPIPLGNLFGKEIRLAGMHTDDYPVFQYAADKLEINGPWAAKKGATLTLMCLGSGQAWREVGRVEA